MHALLITALLAQAPDPLSQKAALAAQYMTNEKADELFALAVALGGTISGEHGVGLVKGGELRRQWAPDATDLHGGIKRLFDPRNLLNPGKKAA